MRCICSYCETLFDLKEPFEDDRETHGMCPECGPIILGNLERELSEPECCVPDGARILNPETDPIENMGPSIRKTGDVRGINSENGS